MRGGVVVATWWRSNGRHGRRATRGCCGRSKQGSGVIDRWGFGHSTWQRGLNGFKPVKLVQNISNVFEFNSKLIQSLIDPN
jgi:hypothetical protein